MREFLNVIYLINKLLETLTCNSLNVNEATQILNAKRTGEKGRSQRFAEMALSII